MMRRLIIGDIHGCYDELQELLQQAGLSSQDEIIAIGDLVDRGPDSARVIEFFRHTPNAHSLLGNHERKHIRSLRGEIPPAASQVITRIQIGEEAYSPAVAFMDTFPRFLDLPEAVLVHGFYEPGVPITEQRENVIFGTLSGEDYLREHYAWPWYALYDGAKPLIVGHRDYSNQMQALVYKERVYMLDSRCVYGGALTGLLLPEFRLISVPSRDDYWTSLRRGYAELLRHYEMK
jgi:serine/threonine protein phosphatase 1